MNFSGEFITVRRPDEVYEFLADPYKFGPLLPDFHSMTVQDATHFTVRLNVNLGSLRSTAEIKMELAEAVAHTRARYKGQGVAMGSQITLGAGFDLSPLPEGTGIAWQGEAGVSGRLAAIAGGMLEPLVRNNLQKLIDALRWALTYPAAQPLCEVAPGQAGPKEQPQIPAAAAETPSAELANPPAETDTSGDVSPPFRPQ
jgi:carbon monoxide dehydrogenase subunit G